MGIPITNRQHYRLGLKDTKLKLMMQHARVGLLCTTIQQHYGGKTKEFLFTSKQTTFETPHTRGPLSTDSIKLFYFHRHVQQTVNTNAEGAKLNYLNMQHILYVCPPKLFSTSTHCIYSALTALLGAKSFT